MNKCKSLTIYICGASTIEEETRCEFYEETNLANARCEHACLNDGNYKTCLSQKARHHRIARDIMDDEDD